MYDSQTPCWMNCMYAISHPQDFQNINITDIIIDNLQNGAQKRITIRFLPVVAKDWKDKYDKVRDKCQYISKQTEETESSVV